MNQSFEMLVRDIFHIGKHTVFVGIVEEGPDYIKTCRCDLFSGDEVLLRGIAIEDEDVFKKDVRSLRTVETVSIDRTVLERGECRLCSAFE